MRPAVLPMFYVGQQNLRIGGSIVHFGKEDTIDSGNFILQESCLVIS